MIPPGRSSDRSRTWGAFPATNFTALPIRFEQADFEKLLADEFLVGVAKEFHEIRIHVDDPPRLGIDDENPVPGGLKETAIT
jgi:hypothetical protein